MEDSDIITLFWNRDEDAIAVTNKKYGKKFKKIAFNILGNNEDAEECLNSAYFKTWNSIPPKRPEALSAFVGKIVRIVEFRTDICMVFPPTMVMELLQSVSILQRLQVAVQM